MLCFTEVDTIREKAPRRYQRIVAILE